MYNRIPNLLLAYHGCDKLVGLKILESKGKLHLQKSSNKYDWLGSGIYFWENSYERALLFAQEAKERKHLTQGRINEPFVIGAVIDLGFCLNLLDSLFINELKKAYDCIIIAGTPLLKNEISESGYFMKRDLDCAVIETLHTLRSIEEQKSFDSVRAVFVEGKELYPSAGFRDKNHIQICIRNPNCIKGYFYPQNSDPDFPVP